jgi:preprotein translocase subunit SecA
MTIRDLQTDDSQTIIDEIITELHDKFTKTGGFNRGSENWKTLVDEINSQFDAAIALLSVDNEKEKLKNRTLTELEAKKARTADQLKRKKKITLGLVDDYWTDHAAKIKDLLHMGDM